jgi:serine/threonine protein kinase
VFRSDGVWLSKNDSDGILEIDDADSNHRAKVKIGLTKRDQQDFVAEVQVQGRVRHPCCVAIFGVCLQPESSFILMEWVGGGTVYTKLGDDGRLP